MRKNPYQTKQMIEILTYLKSVPGVHITASDIYKYFKDQNITIGLTTIYRQLDKLVEQNQVAKYVIDGSTSACYEYLGSKNTSDLCMAFHCKCQKCNKVIHLDCKEVLHFGQHLLLKHNFKLDYKHTVFYGICKDCLAKQNNAQL